MHAALGAVAGILTSGFSWCIYPFFAPEIMRRHYFKKGWIELDEGIVPGGRVDHSRPSESQATKPVAAEIRGSLNERQPSLARRGWSKPTTPSSRWTGSDLLFWGGLSVCGLILLGAVVQIIDPEGARARKAQTSPSTLAPDKTAGKNVTVEAAPNGEAAVVAQRVIRENFDASDCALVTFANRYGDGSIKALCDNGESFRIFTISGVGPVAMRCSAADRMGVSGC